MVAKACRPRQMSQPPIVNLESLLDSDEDDDVAEVRCFVYQSLACANHMKDQFDMQVPRRRYLPPLPGQRQAGLQIDLRSCGTEYHLRHCPCKAPARLQVSGSLTGCQLHVPAEAIDSSASGGILAGLTGMAHCLD